MELRCQFHTLVSYSAGGDSPVGLEYGRFFRTREIPNRDSDLAYPNSLIKKQSHYYYVVSLPYYINNGGHAVTQLVETVRCSRKVTGSIPDSIIRTSH